MEKVTLGKTGLTVSKNGFGCLPIQRIGDSEAAYLLRKAYDHGFSYFDTARSYTDSEHKVGLALGDVRDRIVISTKTASVTAEGVRKDLETSLSELGTDYIDIYQFHNPSFMPVPGGEDGIYDELLKAKEEGKIRFIGITNHRLNIAGEAVDSGLYATLQFPFSYLSDEKDIALVNRCRENGMGFICMKALSGGLIKNSAAAYAFMRRFDNAAPIWGIQRESELDEFISYMDRQPSPDDEMIKVVIEKDREELTGSFCRSCGYCMEGCPEHIQIFQCARMSLNIRRLPEQNWLTPYWQEEMKRIENCRECGNCAKRCPYGLDTPKLLKQNYEDYKTFL